MTQSSPVVAILAALLLLPTSPAPAFLSQGVTMDLRPVAALASAPDLALCRKVETRRVGMVPYWVSSLGYVLSDATCDAAHHWPLPVPIQTFKADGQLSEHVPDAPAFTVVERLRGHLGLILVGAFFLIASFGALARWRMRLVRMEILGLEDGPLFRLIDAMCHAAAMRPRPDPSEIAHIRDLARELTGLDYTSAHIEAAIDRADPLRKPGDFHRFGAALNVRQKSMLLEGVLSVVMADGRLAEAEQRFCRDMTLGLGLARSEAWAARSRVLKRRAAAAPA